MTARRRLVTDDAQPIPQRVALDVLRELHHIVRFTDAQVGGIITILADVRDHPLLLLQATESDARRPGP